MLDLVNEAGLSLVATATADLESQELRACLSANDWTEMHPVAMLALR